MGTPQELTDDDGNVVWANYEYAWGGRYTHFYKEQSLNNVSIDKDHLQPLRFQGQFFDTETSLHYNRFRYYDSDVGMFIQRDPIGLLGGVNVFAYAPNPVGWVDPLGLAVVQGMIQTKDKNKDNTIGYHLSYFHFEGRDKKNGVHPTYSEVKDPSNGWRLLPPTQSIFHDNGIGKPEEKYVHNDGREAVFDGDCLCEMKDPRYKATYNYVNPAEPMNGDYSKLPRWSKDMFGHFFTDVVPYIFGGNARGKH